MKLYEIAFRIILKESISINDINAKLSAGINMVFCHNKYLKKLHLMQGYKGYGFFVREQLPIKAGCVCTLVFRCANEKITNNIKDIMLTGIQNNYFSVMRLYYLKEQEYTPQRKFFTIKSITPVVLTNPDKEATKRYFDYTANEEEIIAAINTGLEKKYKAATGRVIKSDCIETIITLNKVSIVSKYKNGIILGNKYLIMFKDDEQSQKLAFIAANLGIGEKNSIGFGMVNANNDYLYEIIKTKK